MCCSFSPWTEGLLCSSCPIQLLSDLALQGWRWFAVCLIADICTLLGQMWLDFPSLPWCAQLTAPLLSPLALCKAGSRPPWALPGCCLHKVSWCPMCDPFGVLGVGVVVLDQWFSFIPASEVSMNSDVRRPRAFSVAEEGQNAVMSKTRWSVFSQVKNVTTDKATGKDTVYEPISPSPKGCCEAVGELWESWRTGKSSSVERECTSPVCVADPSPGYWNREEIMSLHCAHLPHQTRAEARIVCQSPSGVQMEVS